VKHLFKKNQIIITAFAVMIAIAGYLNYSGALFGGPEDNTTEATAELTNQELLDISEEDLAMEQGDTMSFDSDIDGTPGEAVLTSHIATTIAQAKVAREQVRSQSKETLQTIIDNTNLSEEEREVAILQMVKLTELSEQEVSIETLMAAKGFTNAIVSLTEDSADVVVESSQLTDANRAQIEDIVARKTNISAENIVITPIRE